MVKLHFSSSILLLAVGFAGGLAAGRLLAPPGSESAGGGAGPGGSPPPVGRPAVDDAKADREAGGGDAAAGGTALPPAESEERLVVIRDRSATREGFEALVTQLVREGRRESYVDDFTAAVLAGEHSPTDDLVERIGRLPLASVRARVAGAAGIEMLRGGRNELAAALLEECVRLEESPSTSVDQWAGLDFAASAGVMDLLPAGTGTQELVAQVAEAWAGQDPEAALAFALARPRAVERTGGVRAIFRRLAAEDADSALALFPTLTSPGPSRAAAAREIAHALAGDDFGRAIEWVEEQARGQTHRDLVVSLVFARFAESPEDTALAVAALPEGRSRSVALETVALNWRYRDPAAALAWLGEAHVKGPIPAGVGLVAEEWVARDLEGAVAATVAVDSGPALHPAFLREVADALLARDPEAAAEWAGALPDDVRILILDRVMSGWAEQAPGDAAAHAAALYIDEDGSGNAVARRAVAAVARIWASGDASEFESWATQLSDDGLRSAALKAGAGAMVAAAPELSLRFAWFIPEVDLRDRLVDSIIGHLERTLIASRFLEFTLAAPVPLPVRERLAQRVPIPPEGPPELAPEAEETESSAPDASPPAGEDGSPSDDAPSGE